MNNYEITFITLENLSEKPFKDVLDQVDGHILNISSIGERQFAYPIKKETRGTYTTVLFEMDPSKFAELNRKLTLTEEILRFLITVKKASAMKVLAEAALKAENPELIEAPVEIEAPKEIEEPKEIEAPIEIEEEKKIEKPVEIDKPIVEEVKEEKPKAVKKTVKKVEKVEAVKEKPAEPVVSKEVKEIESETESEEDRLKELDKKLDELLKD